MEKIKIKEAIVVEGKYDKIKLDNIFDTAIITTNGFDIYRNKKRLEMIKLVARQNGVIVLTDSDSAGFRIRSYIKSCFGDMPVKNAYIPEIEGKEKRKESASKEGLLGVEGISDQIIIDAVMQVACPSEKDGQKLTKADFYRLGLTGGTESSNLRAKVCKKLGLPVKMSANRLLEMVNVIYTAEDFEELMENL